jgi:hypothetical protein
MKEIICFYYGTCGRMFSVASDPHAKITTSGAKYGSKIMSIAGKLLSTLRLTLASVSI